MSQALLQSELFAGNDWQVLYRAFTQINFNSFDPPTINAALRQYVQINYPEDYNDWIESSEFVAIIDLLSFLAGSLAFRTDINARENFFQVAEARESILRLARFISYNPHRNFCAQGIVKIVELSTNDDVYDGFGNNLNGQTIQWDDPDNSDWFEQFVLILNSAFINNNQYGAPLKSGSVGGVTTELYRLNDIMSETTVGFSTTVSGQSMDFEIVNPDFDDNGGFYERPPNPANALHLLYRNDSNGFSSPQTGFFFFFKQGTTQNETYNVATPVENNVIALSGTGVNDSDVWVQTVSDSGAVQIDWTKVPAIFSQNITYNDYDPSIRNIFAVVTQPSDGISLRFSDGRFGAVPIGNISCTYRVSNGLQYQIRPADMDRITVTLPYYNRAGVKKNLKATFSLQQTVANSTPAETIDQIRLRAPAVYATQNRMCSGEDYNTFPLQSNLAIKLKAINRIYSGHSRFIDLNDPTGTYQDTNVFSDDGILFAESFKPYTEIPVSLNNTSAVLVSNYIVPLLERDEVTNYVRNYLTSNALTAVTGVTWRKASDAFDSTGSFSGTFSFMAAGASVLFTTPTGTTLWATIAGIDGSATVASAAGIAGPVTLSVVVPDGSTVTSVIPRWSPGLDASVLATVESNLTANTSFSLWFDFSVDPASGNPAWSVQAPTSINATPAVNGTQMKIATVEYVAGGVWRVTALGLRLVFESQGNVQWYNNGARTTAQATDEAVQDIIRVLKVNEDFRAGLGMGLPQNYDFEIDQLYLNRDGSANPARVLVSLADTALTGYPDVPTSFAEIMPSSVQNHYLFWSLTDSGPVPLSTGVNLFDTDALMQASGLPAGSLAFQIASSVSPNLNNTFWLKTNANTSTAGWVQQVNLYSYGIGRGPNTASTYNVTVTPKVNGVGQLSFLWKHYATSDYRIDPARTNIIDIFVLSSAYDYLTRLWIANGCDPSATPAAPTELDLRLAFESYEDYRMFSDQIVWRPVQYQYLFGSTADPSLQAQFKVVKLPNSTLSDGEVQSAVIRAINDYFDVSRWDFGDTFYFTSLAAYIHVQLPLDVASVVLVPASTESTFGDVFEVRCRSDQLFISTAQVSDVVIISSNTASNLKIS